MERSLFDELSSGLVEIRDQPETLRRIKVAEVIEIGEQQEDGMYQVFRGDDVLGTIGKLLGGRWISFPLNSPSTDAYKNYSVFDLRRDAISFLDR